jgi:crossover junction endodeoxyribonuclease RuvC
LKVIGIDPGITATGYGIIKDNELLCTGTIRPKKAKGYSKISEICKNIRDLINTFQPDIAVLEKVFYQKNIQSLIKSSELRGAIIYTLSENKTKILEYTPSQIKLTTTGNGRASKMQVRYFIERLLLESNKKVSNHAIDALAIAYTAIRKLR